MGREEGGGFRKGNTSIPVADSFWYMAKPIQYCKVKLNKIFKKKKGKKKEILYILFTLPLPSFEIIVYIYTSKSLKNFAEKIYVYLIYPIFP